MNMDNARALVGSVWTALWIMLCMGFSAMSVSAAVEKPQNNAATDKKNDVIIVKKTTLSGTQTQKSVTLDISDGVYLVTGDYVVPKDCELIICEGVKLVFSLKCGITVLGKLKINGTKESPVVLKGSGTGLKAWTGIKILRSKDCEISFAHVSGAMLALDTEASDVRVVSSTFFRNTKVADIKERDGAVSFVDCSFAENKDVVHFHFSKVDFDHCTICGNKGYAVEGSYYGDITLSACKVFKNGSGIKDGGYEGTMVAHGCSIYDNRQFDVKNDSSVPGDFTGNWWGKNNTKQLMMKKGKGVKLSKVLGKFVNIAEFLENEAEDCGARACPPLVIK